MNVLLIDDHEMMGELLASLITRRFPLSRVCSATSLIGGLQMIAGSASKEAFSIAVIDLVIKGESEGTTTIKTFRSQYPTIPVLAISGLDAETIAPVVFSQGALGFLPKFCSSDELIRAIESVLRGERFIPDCLKGFILKPPKNTQPRLTDKQLQILELLGSGFSDKSMASSLGISDETVAYHLKNVFRILDASTRTQAITRAFRLGLLEVNRIGLR
jgi:two-component system, NarL family, nitrate/nitrite response regulator NarL